jgi:hypothetical protein
LAEYDFSIDQHAVTFTQLVQAHFGMRDPKNSDDLRRSCAFYYPRLKVEFEGANGAIEELHFCRDIDAGAALTDRTKASLDERMRREPAPRARTERGTRGLGSFRSWFRDRLRRREEDTSIHLTYPSENVAAVTPLFQQALWRCFALSRMGDQLLRVRSSRMLARRAYAIVVNLLSVLDAQKKAQSLPQQKIDRIVSAIETTNQELDQAKKQYVAAARWDSQYAYIKGMLWGLLVVAALLVIAIGFHRGGSFALEEFQPIAVSWSLGAIGAIVSVMSRLASDKFYINYEAEHQSLKALGMFRPLIGAIFGSTLFVLVTGGLLSIEEPRDPQVDSLFFFAGLAFLAGFTERLAPDAFAASARATQPTQPPIQQAEPAGAVLPEGAPSSPSPPIPGSPPEAARKIEPGKDEVAQVSST